VTKVVNDLSTGQCLEAQLEQIISQPVGECAWAYVMEPETVRKFVPQVLLLDEWSSPLSDTRFGKCREKLRKAWRLGVRVIVEVVHPSHSLQQ
jgi:ABC-type polysaccharide/polyol phosphate transport system ATPase subunit